MLAADVTPFDAEFLESHADGFGGAACTEDERFPVMRLQEWAYAVRETNDVGVETFEDIGFAGILISLNPDDVDCTNQTGLFRDLVKEGDDRLLVGDGDVEAAQRGMIFNHLRQEVGRRQLEVEVFGVNTFTGDLIIKERAREGMPKRIPEKTIEDSPPASLMREGIVTFVLCLSFHEVLSLIKEYLAYYFVARYIVLRPKVKRLNCTSLKPQWRSSGTRTSACGKAAIVRGK